MVSRKTPLLWLRKAVAVVLAAAALLIGAISLNPSGAMTVVAALPPRPTPAVTPLPSPTPTPLPRPARKQETAPAPLSHILLTVTPVQGGLWTAVEWQGEDDAWHTVAGWQGTLTAGRQRWAVFERNFGQGPFRWVVYTAADQSIRSVSTPFHLPKTTGEELQIVVELAP